MDNYFKSLFIKAWNVVEIDYTQGLINSERCLQASIYKAIRDCIDNDMSGLRLYVEPNWGSSVPDLVLCDSDSIKAIMEIKYVHDGMPVFENDVSKLIGFQPGSGQYSISRCTEKGVLEKLEYIVGEETLLVFASIGRHDSVAVYRGDIIQWHNKNTPKHEQLDNRLIVLYGRTGHGPNPEFGCDFK